MNDGNKALNGNSGHNIQIFNAFFLRYNKPITAFIYRIVNDFDAAQEIANETFIYAWGSKFYLEKSENRQRQLLFMAGKDRALNHIRNKKRRVARLTKYMELQPKEDFVSYNGYENVIEQQDFADRMGVLNQTLDSLNTGHKEVIQHIVWEEKSYLQTASLLGVTKNTVKSLYQRARKELKKKLISEKATKRKINNGKLKG